MAGGSIQKRGCRSWLPLGSKKKCMYIWEESTIGEPKNGTFSNLIFLQGKQWFWCILNDLNIENIWKWPKKLKEKWQPIRKAVPFSKVSRVSSFRRFPLFLWVGDARSVSDAFLLEPLRKFSKFFKKFSKNFKKFLKNSELSQGVASPLEDLNRHGSVADSF